MRFIQSVVALTFITVIVVPVGCQRGAQSTLVEDNPNELTATIPWFQFDKDWPKLPLPNQWILGTVSGVHVDLRDHVWIVQRPSTLRNAEKEATDEAIYGSHKGPLASCCRPAPPIIEFNQTGNIIQAWGGPGIGYEWPTPGPKSPDSNLGGSPQGEHSVYVDHKDNVWLGSNGPGDAQILKFSRFGKFQLQIGAHGKSQGSDDTLNVNGAADMVVDPITNELFVADGYGNRRVIVFDADTGAYKRHWGAYGMPPDDLDTAAYDPDTQNDQFGIVHGINLSKDGLVYVCDRSNNRIQVFKRDGTYIKEGIVAPNTLNGSVFDIAFSADSEERFAYVLDGRNEKVWILLRDSLDVIDSFGFGGHFGGGFTSAHSISTDSNGNIYVGESWEGKRVQRFRYLGLFPTQQQTTNVNITARERLSQ